MNTSSAKSAAAAAVVALLSSSPSSTLPPTTTTTTNTLSPNDEQLVKPNDEFVYNFEPNLFEWCLLIFAFTIFVIGIIGNLLVIIVVVKNAHMRTITNIFIVNLAIGDFLVILICLPPSVITDIAGNWWFGETMCKIIPFVQVSSIYKPLRFFMFID